MAQIKKKRTVQKFKDFSIPRILREINFDDTLSRFKIVLAELNFYDLYEHQHSFSELEKYLLPHGFKLFDISHISKNPMNGRTDWVDVVYVRSV